MHNLVNNCASHLDGVHAPGDTTISVFKTPAPFNDPPEPIGGHPVKLTLVDNLATPTKFEIISYTGRSSNGSLWDLTGVTRALEGTTAQSWADEDFAYMAITAGMMDCTTIECKTFAEFTTVLAAVNTISDHVIIRLTPGNYSITSTITLYGNMTLELEGVTFDFNLSASGHMFEFDVSGTPTLYNGVKDVTIKGATFDGGDNVNVLTLMMIAHCDRIKFEDCIFKQINVGTMIEIGSSRHVHFNRCTFEDLDNTGGAVHMIRLQGANNSTGLYNGGGAFDETECNDLRWNNCKFVDGYVAVATPNSSVFTGKPQRNIQFNECYFNNFPGNTIQGQSWNGLLIKNCIFHGTYRALSMIETSTTQPSENIGIYNNYIQNSDINDAERSIGIWGHDTNTALRIKNVIIKGNQCYDARRHAIQVNYIDGLIVEGNVCRKHNRAGIWIWECNDGVIKENRSMDAGSYYNPRRDIYIGATVSTTAADTSNFIVIGNYGQGMALDYCTDCVGYGNFTTSLFTITGNAVNAQKLRHFDSGTTWVP